MLHTQGNYFKVEAMTTQNLNAHCQWGVVVLLVEQEFDSSRVCGSDSESNLTLLFGEVVGDSEQ